MLLLTYFRIIQPIMKDCLNQHTSQIYTKIWSHSFTSIAESFSGGSESDCFKKLFTRIGFDILTLPTYLLVQYVSCTIYFFVNDFYCRQLISFLLFKFQWGLLNWMHCSVALIMPFKCMQTMLLISWVCSLYALSKSIDYVWSFSTETYTSTMGYHVGSKEDLVPPEPVLTRYRKEAGIKAFVKKEILDPRMSEERRSSEINILTTAALCVQLNTLHVSVLTSPFIFFIFLRKVKCLYNTYVAFLYFLWVGYFIYLLLF